nr:hypothetical protein [Tanacetum cinerariifolium]
MCDMVGQYIQKKEEEKQIEEEQAAKARYWKIFVCYDDDDEDYTIVITPTKPDNSLSMGDEHLDTIQATESNEFIKSSVENLVPNPSESNGKHECDVPACEVFTTFSNILFDADYDFSSSDDQSFDDEDIPKKIYSNPLFDEEIIFMKMDPHHFNAESDLIESLLNRDSAIISSSSKIDSLFDEFAGELTLLKSIPLGIKETVCDPEEEIRLIKRLLYDNSSPRPPKEFISKNSDAAFESFSLFPIPVEDNDSLMEEINLSFTPDDPMPPGIKEDDYDSERDILILEEFLSNDSLLLPENESFHFDIPSSSCKTTGCIPRNVKTHAEGFLSSSLHFFSFIRESFVMSRDVLTVGSTMRISLLYRGEYSQGVERFMNYFEEQTDREAMINSIKNGDQPLPRVTQVSIAGTTSTEQPPLKDKSMWSDQEKRVQKIDRLARSLLIQGLSNDIYSLIDSNKTAKDLWDALARHMLGSEYGEQDRKAAVLYEYKTFKATEGELLLDTYIRYLQVINDLKKCGYSKYNCELNFKFLNNLQPEWKQYATMMRQNKNLMDINIDSLYNILKQNQGDVNDAMGSKKKNVVLDRPMKLGDCATWDGGKTTWGGRVEAMGTVPVCALLRKELKEVWFTICEENGILQGLLDTSESSNDNTNVVNAHQEPFVVKQDPGAYYGYNCPPKVSIIPNPEPCNNQTIDELPLTLPSFDPTCYFGDGNSFTNDSKSNIVDDSPNVFNPPSQP